MNKGKQKVSLLLLGVLCLMLLICPITTKASGSRVTAYQKITWGISTGRYYVDGKHAFCAQYHKEWPTVGTEISSIIPCTNELVRKALYYGYNGPCNILGTDDRAHVLTAIAVSDANIGERETGASAKYDEFYWELVNNPEKYPVPPSNFKVYFAVPISEKMQTLAFYELQQKGYVNAVKVSANEEWTKENPCYSLEGAVYGLYSDVSAEEQFLVGQLTMDVNGQSNTVELPFGNYYAKELVAPKGYAKNEQVVSFVIKDTQTLTLQFKDHPQCNPIDILIQKVDSDTGEGKAQGNASLKGAQFTVQFYKGYWDEKPDIAPQKTWLLETDAFGVVRLQEELPLGTLVIQETKAPEGYLINDTIYVRKIMAEGEDVHVFTYECPIVKEKALKWNLKKYHIGTEIPIEGTVFRYTKPDGSVEELTTDKNGEITVVGLAYGTHELQEISAANGYVNSKEVYRFVVDETIKEDISIIAYNSPAPYELTVLKTDAYKNLLEGAEFTLYADKECKTAIEKGMTNANGELCFKQLEVGKTYYLKETKAPGGYMEKTQIYEIYVNSIPARNEFETYINGQKTEDLKGTVRLTVPNEIKYEIPNTGSSKTIILIITGVTLCGISMYFMKKKRRKEYEKI